MSITRERRAFLKEQARHFAANVIEELEFIASTRFDDLNLSEEEATIVESEKHAIADRISKAFRSPSPQTKTVGSPAGCVEEFYEGDEVAYLRDTLKEVTKERDHFHNQWRSCWAPLTPRSENEKQGVERVLAILKSKLSDGGGIVGPSDVQRAHNDFYRGRRVAFEECAAMLRAALATTEGQS